MPRSSFWPLRCRALRAFSFNKLRHWKHKHAFLFPSMVLYTVKWLHLSDQALRGVGGIILNAEGHRFCNELGRGGLRRSVARCLLVLTKAVTM